MEDKTTYILGEISTMKYGKLPPKEIDKGKYPIWSGYRTVGYCNEFNCAKGDVIIVARGVGGTGDVKIAKENCYLTNLSIHVKLDCNICLPEYFYYRFLLSNLKYLDSGSAQSQITIDDLKRLTLALPPLAQQYKTVNILRSFDNKIELNNRINHNLEEQAQALYKSWFVDFEPFRGGKFVDSELGMIPEGWRVAELGTVTRQSSQKVKDRIDVKVLSPVTTGELVLSEEYFTKQVFSESISKYIVVKPLHFAYNPARVNIGSIGMNMFSFDGCVSPVYVVFECEKGYHHFFDYYRKTESFKDEVLNRAIGGVRQTLSYKDFALIKLVYPPYDIVEKFNCIYAGLLENKNSIKREISKLSELRDTLLPKLLSGELKINDLTC